MQSSSAGLPPTRWHCFWQVTSLILPCLSEALCVLLASLPTGVPVKQKTSLDFQRLDLLTYLKVSAFILGPGFEHFVLGAMAIPLAPPTKVLLHRLITHVSPMLSVLLTPSHLPPNLHLDFVLAPNICPLFVLVVPLEPSSRTPPCPVHLLMHEASQSPALLTGPSCFSVSLNPRSGMSRNFLSRGK